MPLSLGELKQQLKTMLKPVCASEAQIEAETCLIFDKLLGFSMISVYQQPDLKISSAQWAQIQSVLKKRTMQRVPIQYLFAEAYFYGLTFHVSPAVLIPRPETELLVEKALALVNEFDYQTILDVGTGSGCIAITVAHQLPQVNVTATDISMEALGVAIHNNQTLKTQVSFKQGNLFEPVSGHYFDLIVSNPPYIDLTLQDTLTPEVKDHEPHQALFAPPEQTYYFYEQLAEQAHRHLTAQGSILMEFGMGMHSQIEVIFKQAGYAQVEFLPDYSGITRLVWAKRAN